MNQEVSTINISIPTDELNNVSSIDITLSVKKIDAQSKVMVENTTEGTNAELEIAKVDREQKLVYDLCEGYDPDFLGINIHFPQPAGSLKKEIALQEDKIAELKYFLYSLIL